MGESQSRTQLAFSTPSFCILLVLLLLSLFLGCRTQAVRSAAPPIDTGVPRISPAYTQWLEQQSMLGCAQNLIAHVSGTNRILQNSGTEERYPLLLQEAPTWLDVNPNTTTLKTPVFAYLAREELLKTLSDLAIQGIYIAPTGEADIWSTQASDRTEGAITSFAFSPRAGDEQAFLRLQKNARAYSLQLGGALPPAATGIGPDFFLQMRGLDRYQGLYTAVALPQETWFALPTLSKENDVSALSAKAFAHLVEQGLLPERLHRQALSWTDPMGWAVTSAIRGVDGTTRRFAYCYDTSVDRPILFWQDPSGLAKRLYAAAAIRHTGLEQHTLAALPLKALIGLDPLRRGEHSPDPSSQLEPGFSAIADLTQAIHRYGGWCVTEEIFPPAVLSLLLAKTDFANDQLIPSAIAQALANGNIESLVAALTAYHKHAIPQKRLAHGLGTWTNKKLPFADETLLTLALPIALPGLAVLPDQILGAIDEQSRSRQANTKSVETQKKSLRELAHLLRARKYLKAALGEIEWNEQKQGDGCLLLVNRLPQGGLWCVAVNFSHKKQQITLPKPRSMDAKLFDLSNQGELVKKKEVLTATLLPREARHWFLGPAAHLVDMKKNRQR